MINSIALSGYYKSFDKMSVKIELLCVAEFFIAIVYHEQAVWFLNSNFRMYNYVIMSC